MRNVFRVNQKPHGLARGERFVRSLAGCLARKVSGMRRQKKRPELVPEFLFRSLGYKSGFFAGALLARDDYE